MNLGELRSEVQARGYNHIPDARCNLWINQAIQEINEAHAWPYLETTATGVAPLSITDVRQILSVASNDVVLSGMERRSLTQLDPSMDDAGTATHWYLDGNSLRVYPLDTTSSLSVRYLKVPTDLSADASSPDMPARFHDLIVDGAVYRALKDDDEYENAAALRQMWGTGLQSMADSLLSRNFANPDFIQVTDYEAWRGSY